jgi:ArsR family transcriptional regulator, lead/cadmium/zinc/bismuth-responsive transcriptional repressor
VPSNWPLERETAVALADFFTAMSDPTRVLIIAMLAEQDVEVPVQELAEAVDVTPSAVSHQLRLLRQLRVVKARQQGRQKF